MADLMLTEKITFVLAMAFSYHLTHLNPFAECSCNITIYPTVLYVSSRLGDGGAFTTFNMQHQHHIGFL